MRRALAALILTAPLFLPVAAWAQAESREGIYLQNQILQLRQEGVELRRGGGSALGGPVQVAPPPRGGTPAAPQGEILGALLERVSALEEETRRLRGPLEESEYRGRTLEQTVEKLQGDIDYRLQQMENQPGGGRAAAPAAPARPPAAAAPAAPPPIAARPPERALADGQAALNRRDYPAAEAAAREALANRGSPRATDAQLLLGDALTGKRDFAGAALAYNDAYTRSRTGPRAPEALLGLAGAFNNLGNKREACETLNDLRSNFPNLRGALAERAADGPAPGRLPLGHGRGAVEPVSAAEFAALMAPLGPFGPAPGIAAGVSGGPDSLALALLADAWARARGGALLAWCGPRAARRERRRGDRRGGATGRPRHRRAAAVAGPGGRAGIAGPGARCPPGRPAGRLPRGRAALAAARPSTMPTRRKRCCSGLCAAAARPGWRRWRRCARRPRR